MFRAYCYLSTGFAEFGLGLTRLTAEPCETQETADRVLAQLQTFPGVSGGSIEQNVPGIGWVLAEEVESAVIGARRAASEAEFGGLGNVSNGFAHS